MDIRPAAGLPITASPGLPGAVSPDLPAIDVLAEILREDAVATSQFVSLLLSIEAQLFSPAASPVLDGLLQTAIAAIAHHDVPRAISTLAELIEQAPDHAAAILDLPALQPVHRETRALLDRMTQAARSDAEERLATGTAVALPEERPILTLATYLIETRSLGSYRRASELCKRLESASRKSGGRSLRLWRRVPLLVILAGWMAAGLALILIVGGDAVTLIWGIGFLALVVLQFLVTTRNQRHYLSFTMRTRWGGVASIETKEKQ